MITLIVRYAYMVCLCAGGFLQDTFTEEGNALCLIPVFKIHAAATSAKRFPSKCSKDMFEINVTIHFQKSWLKSIQDNADVNHVGSILGFAYGKTYWCPTTIASFLPNDKVKQKCRVY